MSKEQYLPVLILIVGVVYLFQHDKATESARSERLKLFGEQVEKDQREELRLLQELRQQVTNAANDVTKTAKASTRLAAEEKRLSELNAAMLDIDRKVSMAQKMLHNQSQITFNQDQDVHDCLGQLSNATEDTFLHHSELETLREQKEQEMRRHEELQSQVIMARARQEHHEQGHRTKAPVRETKAEVTSKPTEVAAKRKQKRLIEEDGDAATGQPQIRKSAVKAPVEHVDQSSSSHDGEANHPRARPHRRATVHRGAMDSDDASTEPEPLEQPPQRRKSVVKAKLGEDSSSSGGDDSTHPRPHVKIQEKKVKHDTGSEEQEQQQHVAVRFHAAASDSDSGAGPELKKLKAQFAERRRRHAAKAEEKEREGEEANPKTGKDTSDASHPDSLQAQQHADRSRLDWAKKELARKYGAEKAGEIMDQVIHGNGVLTDPPVHGQDKGGRDNQGWRYHQQKQLERENVDRHLRNFDNSS